MKINKLLSVLTSKKLLLILTLALAFTTVADAQYKTFTDAATTATDSLKQNVNAVLVIIQIICAAVSIFSLGWALWRRNKGDGQSNDAIMTVFISLIVVMIILEVVKAVWLG